MIVLMSSVTCCAPRRMSDLASLGAGGVVDRWGLQGLEETVYTLARGFIACGQIGMHSLSVRRMSR
jgi:hypothetical protein